MILQILIWLVSWWHETWSCLLTTCGLEMLSHDLFSIQTLIFFYCSALLHSRALWNERWAWVGCHGDSTVAPGQPRRRNRLNRGNFKIYEMKTDRQILQALYCSAIDEQWKWYDDDDDEWIKWNASWCIESSIVSKVSECLEGYHKPRI